MRSALILFVGLLLAGCATQPDEIGSAYVSPLHYKNFDCEQLELEAERVSRRVLELHRSLEEEADADEAQFAVSLILLWPAIFWLEGGDDFRANEYSRLKGERDAIEMVSIQKKCSIEFKKFAPPKKKEDDGSQQEPMQTVTPSTGTKSPYIGDRLKQLDALFKQEIISKQEYEQRRKEILKEL